MHSDTLSAFAKNVFEKNRRYTIKVNLTVMQVVHTIVLNHDPHKSTNYL